VESPVKVPTMKGVSSSFKDFGIAALGGLGIAILSRFFGSLAFLAAPVLAGSMIKSDTGKIITGVFGLLLGMSLLGGSTNTSSAETARGTM